MDNRPIGVFDSGLGGLTAVKELRELLPSEDIIYFGDTGRVPYGGRSCETITRYAMQDVSFLLQHDVKAVVSACGTVSSVAGELLAERCPCPYIEVVSPAVRRAADISVTGRIGVIATRATIGSGKFQQKLLALMPRATVIAEPCPLFVPLVEEGHTGSNDDLVQKVVQMYLGQVRRQNVDTLILGCTHYPMLADAIALYMGKEVVLVDSGKEAAKATAASLEALGLLGDSGRSGDITCCLTDTGGSFSQVAKLFLGSQADISMEQVSLELLESSAALEAKNR